MPTSSTASSTSHSSRRRRGRNQNYTSLATNNQDEDDDDDVDIDENSIIEEFHDEPASTNAPVTTTTTISRTMKSLVDDESDNEEDEKEKDTNENANEMITIIILDSAQKKFPIQCHPSWTVGKFKYQSSLVHKVHPKQQRLIFRGKMLTNDTQTLEQQHIIASDITVHLFPKPIIKITPTTTNTTNTNGGSGQGNSNNNNNASNDNGETEDGTGSGGGGGAHVPSIVIDQEEQDRRGQILVLGSVEIAESQNNVKMLSLLLVMICAMRLLSLFSIAMGGGEPLLIENDGDQQVHNHTAEHPQSTTHHTTGIYDNDFLDDTVELLESGDNYEPRAWALSDYYDLLVSSIGFYVGTLGMKATQENTLQLATMYAIGTIIAGILWNVWNVYEYFEFFEEQQTLHKDNTYENHQQHDHYSNHDPNHPQNYQDGNGEEELPPLTRDDFVTVAFFTILMPLCVWFLCCVRAFEFRRLISEAEDEASERIRNEYVDDTENGGGDDGDGDGTNSITEIV